MFDVTLGSEYISQLDGTSEGTQLKYYKDKYWYKIDTCGESKAERTPWELLTKQYVPDSFYFL